jgi:hypothetical protein
LRLRTVKGVESQFYLLSDIGEGALVLPLEPAFYWASTNNGDDNQLFADVLTQTNNDFWAALEQVVRIAPNGAKSLQEAMVRMSAAAPVEEGGVSNIVMNAVGSAAGSGE